MKEQFQCPQCGVNFSADSSYKGSKARCPKCQAVIVLTSNEQKEIGFLENASGSTKTNSSPNSVPRSPVNSPLSSGPSPSNAPSSSSSASSAKSVSPFDQAPIVNKSFSKSHEKIPVVNSNSSSNYSSQTDNAANSSTYGFAPDNGFGNLDDLVKMESQATAKSDVSKPRQRVSSSFSENDFANDPSQESSYRSYHSSSSSSSGGSGKIAQLESCREAFMKSFFLFLGLCLFSFLSIQFTPRSWGYAIVAAPGFTFIIGFFTLLRYFKMCSLIWGPAGAVGALIFSFIPLVNIVVFIMALASAYGEGGKASNKVRPPRPFYKSPILWVIAGFLILIVIIIPAMLVAVSMARKAGKEVRNREQMVQRSTAPKQRTDQMQKNTESMQKIESPKNSFSIPKNSRADSPSVKSEEKVEDFPVLNYAVNGGNLIIDKILLPLRGSIRFYDIDSNGRLDPLEFRHFYLDRVNSDLGFFFKEDHQQWIDKNRDKNGKLPDFIRSDNRPGMNGRDTAPKLQSPSGFMGATQKRLTDFPCLTYAATDNKLDINKILPELRDIPKKYDMNFDNILDENEFSAFYSQSHNGLSKMFFEKDHQKLAQEMKERSSGLLKLPNEGNASSAVSKVTESKKTQSNTVKKDVKENDKGNSKDFPVNVMFFIDGKGKMIRTDGPMEISKMKELGVPDFAIELAQQVDKKKTNDGFIDFHETFDWVRQIRQAERKVKK